MPLEAEKRAFLEARRADWRKARLMDRRRGVVCHGWLRGNCPTGDACTYRHAQLDEPDPRWPDEDVLVGVLLAFPSLPVLSS